MKKNMIILGLVVGFLGQSINASQKVVTEASLVELQKNKDDMVNVIANLFLSNGIDTKTIDSFCNDFSMALNNVSELSKDTLEAVVTKVADNYPLLLSKKFYTMKFVKKNGLKKGGNSFWVFIGAGVVGMIGGILAAIVPPM